MSNPEYHVEDTLNHEVIIDEGYEKMSPHYSDFEFESLVESIREHGQIVPGIVNSDYVLLDGHHRNKACKEIGIPFIYERPWKPKSREQELDFIFEVNTCRAHAHDIGQIKMLKAYEDELAKIGIGLEIKKGKGKGWSLLVKTKKEAERQTKLPIEE